MLLEDLIKTDSVLCNAPARSKKHCLEILSELLAQNNPDIANEEIFAQLVERERLGCTSLNQGVALPRCRVAGVSTSSCAVMKLSKAVDFDSADRLPVDLVFGFMVPANIDASHHADVKMVTAMLMDDALRTRLRAATSSSELYDTVMTAQPLPLAQMPPVNGK